MHWNCNYFQHLPPPLPSCCSNYWSLLLSLCLSPCLSIPLLNLKSIFFTLNLFYFGSQNVRFYLETTLNFSYDCLYSCCLKVLLTNSKVQLFTLFLLNSIFLYCKSFLLWKDLASQVRFCYHLAEKLFVFNWVLMDLWIQSFHHLSLMNAKFIQFSAVMLCLAAVSSTKLQTPKILSQLIVMPCFH